MDEGSYQSFLQELNPKQREAVLHTTTPLLILAGAGSGKTRVITTKIAHALHVLKTDPRSILAVTFTNKAAGEMRDRLASLAPNAGELMIRTFHSFGAWVLRRYGNDIGISQRFLIYDDSDMLSLLKTDLKGDHSPNEIQQYLFWIMRAKDLCLSSGDPLESITRDAQFPQIYARYEERLAVTGNLDFGDLIMKTVLLLKQSENARRTLQERFSMILVDEYQDSNIAQYELLKALYAHGTFLCVVGDDDQSIYGFRGAEVENILTFSQSFPGTVIIRLEENYRSTKTILAAASAVIAHNRKRLGKTLCTANDQGEHIDLVILKNHTEEARCAARLIEENPEQQTAILYRMNYQSRIFEEVFSQRCIPYVLVGSLRFYEREEVKDVLAYCALVLNPRDEVAARRILNKPPRGIGEKTAGTLFAALPDFEGNLDEALKNRDSFFKGRAAQAFQAFSLLLANLRQFLNTSSLAQFIHELVMQAGLYDFYKEKDIIEGTSKMKNLEELVNATMSYGTGEEALREFLENALLQNPEDLGSFRHRVTLITLHNTKGLEFDRVIITGCEEGVFPVTRDDDGDDRIEEERRLFYVGLTRAKQKLVLSVCKSRFLFGTMITPPISRFIGEIPEEYISKTDLTGFQAPDNSAFPRGSRVYSDDYGPGVVVKNEIKNDSEVVVVRFESGREVRIIPKYHDLVRIRDE
jgi:DNA helicase-2/ATP-dependent DNA helicase PcrA